MIHFPITINQEDVLLVKVDNHKVPMDIITFWKKMQTFPFQIALWVIAMESFGTPPNPFQCRIYHPYG
jgi:hypothetical protein